MKQKGKTNLLASRYPAMYDEDDHPRWAPITADIVAYARELLGPADALMLVILFIEKNFDADVSVVRITDAVLAERLGTVASHVRKSRARLVAAGVVSVQPGRKRSLGDRGCATAYDLMPAFLGVREWRKRQAPTAERTVVDVPAVPRVATPAPQVVRRVATAASAERSIVERAERSIVEEDGLDFALGARREHRAAPPPVSRVAPAPAPAPAALHPAIAAMLAADQAVIAPYYDSTHPHAWLVRCAAISLNRGKTSDPALQRAGWKAVYARWEASGIPLDDDSAEAFGNHVRGVAQRSTPSTTVLDVFDDWAAARPLLPAAQGAGPQQVAA